MKQWAKRHPKLAIVGVLTVITVLVGIAMTIADHQRSHAIRTSLDQVVSTLHKEGISAERTGGCGRAKLNYGYGSKMCSQGLEFITHMPSEEAASDVLIALDAKMQAAKFVDLGHDPDQFTELSSLMKAVSYTHESTPVDCGVSYDYDRLYDEDSPILAERRDTQGTLSVYVSCDDNSWFLRNILHNTLDRS